MRKGSKGKWTLAIYYNDFHKRMHKGRANDWNGEYCTLSIRQMEVITSKLCGHGWRGDPKHCDCKKISRVVVAGYSCFIVDCKHTDDGLYRIQRSYVTEEF